MSQCNCLRLEIGILDSLLRQWNGVLNIFISRILARFCYNLLIIFFKIFDDFCTFLNLRSVLANEAF